MEMKKMNEKYSNGELAGMAHACHSSVEEKEPSLRSASVT